MKKRSFDPGEEDDADERTETSPLALRAIGLVMLSWLMPLALVVSAFLDAETTTAGIWVARLAFLSAIGLALAAVRLALRVLREAGTNPRLRRGAAMAAIALAIGSSGVWMAELVLAERVVLVRERLDAAAMEAAGPAE